jgi:RNA polymerase sigma-70 factor (ECF subfamily)
MVAVFSSESGATRSSLLARACAGQQAAWSELVDLYGPLVAHWCRRHGVDVHGTADCLQEVFASVARSLGGFKPAGRGGAFRGWLWTITLNKLRDRARREGLHAAGQGGSTALRQLHELPTADRSVWEESSNDPTTAGEQVQLVRRAMKQVQQEFTARTWEIFTRSVIEQLPTHVVAEQFSITEATVRQIRSRVLRRLRQQMGDL